MTRRLQTWKDSPQPQRPLLVGVLEDEARLQLLLLVVHLGADQEQRRLGVDQELDAAGLDHLVHRLLLVGELQRVAHARAALAAHADAMPTVGLPRPSISALARSAAAGVTVMTCGRGRRGRGGAAGLAASVVVGVLMIELYSAASLVSSFFAVLAR
jgi:hypothetical protein